jgi:putative salt-induced outer membrane protein
MRLFTALNLLVFTSLATPYLASAQEPAPASEEEVESAEVEPIWSSQVGLSYLATTGNSETETFGLDLQATRRPTPWGLEITALFNRAEEDGEKTAERYYAGVRGTRALTKRWDAFAGLSAEQDEFAGIDLRGIIEAGAVYKALLGPRHILDLDLALNWTDEDRLPPEMDESWFGGLAGLDYKFAISDSATFSQALRYFANFDDTAAWRADSLTAVTAALNKRLALRLSYEVRYRNEPIGDNEDTDTTTKVSLVWSI